MIEIESIPKGERIREGRFLASILVAFLVILASTSIPLSGNHLPRASSQGANSSLASLPASSGSEVLGTGVAYYSTAYNTYVMWTQTVYADSVSYFADHISFSNAGLGSSTAPAWTFGVGVNGDNLTISQITASYVELDETPLTTKASVYFYYYGGSPLSVTVGNASIPSSSFATLPSCTLVCVYLNQASGYIEILNPAATSGTILVYPGAQPTSTTTTTPSPPPPPATTTTTTTAKTSSTTTTTSTTQSSVTTVVTTVPAPPPPIITQTVSSTSTKTVTTSSTTSTTQTSSSTSTSSSESTSLTNSSTSSSSSSSTQSTITSVESTSQSSETSITFSNSTAARPTNFLGSVVAVFGSIPFFKSAAVPFGISVFAVLVGVATFAPFALRRVSDEVSYVKRKIERIIRRRRRDDPGGWR